MPLKLSIKQLLIKWRVKPCTLSSICAHNVNDRGQICPFQINLQKQVRYIAIERLHPNLTSSFKLTDSFFHTVKREGQTSPKSNHLPMKLHQLLICSFFSVIVPTHRQTSCHFVGMQGNKKWMTLTDCDKTAARWFTYRSV